MTPIRILKKLLCMRVEVFLSEKNIFFHAVELQ